MKEKIERLLKWSNGHEVGPLSVEIWPTNRCNLRCIMCGTWASRRNLEKSGIKYNVQDEIKSELSDKKLFEVLLESIELGAKEFLITGGGEPFVRRNITLQMMKEIKKHSLFGNLNTNGTLMESKDVSQIIEMSWDMIMFSLDGHNPKIHDYIRNVSGTFDKVVNILNEFKRLKKESNSETPKIVFNTVLTNKNYKDISQMIEFARDVECENITFIPLIAYDESVKILELNKTQKSEFYDLIPSFIDKSKEVGISTNLEDIRNQFIKDTVKMDDIILTEIESLPAGNFSSLPCFEPFLHVLIKPNGEVSCCCMVDSLKESLKEKSLKEIWYGKIFQEFRDSFLKKKLPKDCKTCVFSQFIRNREIRKRLSELEHQQY